MKVYCVYILKCSDNTYYTGITSNLEERLLQHQTGFYQSSYTFNRRPVELKYYTNFLNSGIAIDFEKKIKKWSKVKKVALINSEYDNLPNLAKKKFNK